MEPPAAYIASMETASSKVWIPITQPVFSIGRAPDRDLFLNDPTASRHHCSIYTDNGQLFIEDHESQNGTYHNGRRIRGRVQLLPPTWLMVGQTKLAVLTLGHEVNTLTLLKSAFSEKDSILLPATGYLTKSQQALLVIDIVNSTQLIRRAQGTSQLNNILFALGNALERTLKEEPQPFLKSIGDGFFACFDQPQTALATAIRMAATLNKESMPAIKLSMALHWGSTQVTAQGDRAGRDVYAVFALEDLRHKEEKVNDVLAEQPSSAFITMTNTFRAQLDDFLQAQTAALGAYQLKGLSHQEPIFYWAK